MSDLADLLGELEQPGARPARRCRFDRTGLVAWLPAHESTYPLLAGGLADAGR
ncbi:MULTISPECIES: hypothetical protein [unclassified Streptomyces]|uniref:hypothetical protein n=1 Tax=unclassified Streptomyces TaxID=2593676 RepID=UPI0014478294|nr:hypothetical protein [Streptomyces sp. A1136]